MTKQWFQSRTFWVNTLTLIAVFVQSRFGFIIDADTQIAILTILNIILRFDTNTEIK